MREARISMASLNTAGAGESSGSEDESSRSRILVIEQNEENSVGSSEVGQVLGKRANMSRCCGEFESRSGEYVHAWDAIAAVCVKVEGGNQHTMKFPDSAYADSYCAPHKKSQAICLVSSYSKILSELIATFCQALENSLGLVSRRVNQTWGGWTTARGFPTAPAQRGIAPPRKIEGEIFLTLATLRWYHKQIQSCL